MECPRCTKEILKPNHYEGVEIDTCPSCKGAWLDLGEATHIVQIREKKFTSQTVTAALESAQGGIPEHEINHDLNCPKCSQAMKPVNYAVNSGIIIDRCKSNHGLWFDHQELEKIQAYREHWQDHVKENEAKLNKLASEVPEMKDDKSPTVLFAIAKFFSDYL